MYVERERKRNTFKQIRNLNNIPRHSYNCIAIYMEVVIMYVLMLQYLYTNCSMYVHMYTHDYVIII